VSAEARHRDVGFPVAIVDRRIKDDRRPVLIESGVARPQIAVERGGPGHTGWGTRIVFVASISASPAASAANMPAFAAVLVLTK